MDVKRTLHFLFDAEHPFFNVVLRLDYGLKFVFFAFFGLHVRNDFAALAEIQFLAVVIKFLQVRLDRHRVACAQNFEQIFVRNKVETRQSHSFTLQVCNKGLFTFVKLHLQCLESFLAVTGVGTIATDATSKHIRVLVHSLHDLAVVSISLAEFLGFLR